MIERVRSRFIGTTLLVIGLFALMLVAVTTADGASAADDGPILMIRRVDSIDPANTRLQFLYTGPEGDIANARLIENDLPVETGAPTPFAGTSKIAIALVFDNSAQADSTGVLVEAKSAAKDWLTSRSQAEKDTQIVAVYETVGTTLMVQDFTSDEQRITSALDRVGPATDESVADQSQLWGAVKQAASSLGEQGGYQPNLVLMAVQGDTASGQLQGAARGQVATSRSGVFAVTYSGGSGINVAPIRALVDDNGVELVEAADSSAVADAIKSIGTTISSKQYEILYPSAVPQTAIANLVLEVGGESDDATFVVGGDASGKQALMARANTSSGGIAFLQGGIGLTFAIVLTLIAVSGIAYAVTLLVSKDDGLQTIVDRYSETYLTDVEDEDGQSALAKTALMQRAVELTEQVAEGRGVLPRVEGALERANLPLRAGEALFFYVVMVVVLTIIGLVLLANIFGGIIFGGIAAIIPIMVVSVMAARRRKSFLSLLPDTLQLLSGTLKAGYSLMQGVEAVSQEVAEPMGAELRRVVTEARLGRPLEEALDGVAQRMDSADFAWAVMAIQIQREVGGNLSELLLTVAETMTARERLRRDVAALTAEGRMSAIMLGALPLLLGLAMFAMNKEYMSKLIDTTMGNVLMGLALVSMAIGFLWMKKIIDIEI